MEFHVERLNAQIYGGTPTWRRQSPGLKLTLRDESEGSKWD